VGTVWEVNREAARNSMWGVALQVAVIGLENRSDIPPAGSGSNQRAGAWARSHKPREARDRSLWRTRATVSRIFTQDPIIGPLARSKRWAVVTSLGSTGQLARLSHRHEVHMESFRRDVLLRPLLRGWVVRHCPFLS
jgi:hypothetical protein